MHLQDDHFFNQLSSFSPFPSPHSTPRDNYYEDYCKLYLANYVLTNQVKDLLRDKKVLEEKVYQLEERQNEEEGSQMGRKDREKEKRMRRTAVDIHRFYGCQVQGCGKAYGSEGSLFQHLKIKHPDVEILKREEDGEYSQSVGFSKENMTYNTQKQSGRENVKGNGRKK